MFRAQQNAFDEVVVKATDENLTSENWEFILDVCDKVQGQDSGAKDAVAAMIKRLAHRNANVQLYTLELANALSQNCGLKMHKELASRSFTDALLRLAADRNTHQQVKGKILERMAEWTEMFSRDPDLGIMEQAYMKLKSQNPNLHPPSKPQKTQITDADRQREEQELQMALALSIKDKSTTPKAGTQPQTEASSSSESPAQPAVPQGTTAATVSRVRALFDFTPSEPGELQFRKGDIIAVLESVYKDWWKGSLRGNTGIFPLNYVEKLQDPTKEELEREASMEAEVFGQMGNVEKLLALLSTSSREVGDVRENEEITTLYHSTLAIRPKLIELIGKYSQKKDDFTQLNEKFIKARRDYENLLEASMSHPQGPPHGYGRPPYQGQPQQYPSAGYTVPMPSQQQQQNLHSHQQQYGYLPQGSQGQPSYGGPPQDQRIYSPTPESHSGAPQYPAQNGPAPFYMIPPGQQPQAPIGQRNSPKPGSADPYTQAQRQASGGAGRPVSMAIPPSQGQPHTQPAGGGAPAVQELATGSFDSPIDHRHSFPPTNQQQQPPPQQDQQGYPSQMPLQRQPSYAESPSSVYSSQTNLPGAPTAAPQQQQQNIPPHPNHPPPAQPPLRDPYAEPPQPQQRYSLYGTHPQQQPSQPPDSDSPIAQTGPYPTFPASGSGGGPPYQAYGGQGGTVRAGGGDEEGFYR